MSGAPANLGRGDLMAGLGPQPVRNLGRGNLMLGLGAPVRPVAPGASGFPGTTGPPPASPASPAATAAGASGGGVDYDINLPVDPAWAADRLAAEKTHEAQQAGLTGQRTRSLSDYGYSEAAGGALSFDPNNPFSKAALLKQTYDRSRRSSAQSMGSSGGLYSGAFQNQQDFVNRGQLGAEDTMTKALQGFLAQNTTAREQATNDYWAANARADAARMGRLASNPLYQPSASQNADPGIEPDAPAELAPAPPGAPRKPKAKKGGGVRNLGRGNLMTKLR